MSAEMMMFPATVDEFMEQYKIVDTEEIYTNGTEFVPIFRMKQWFEHLDAVPVVRCKYCKHSRKDDIFHTRWCQKPGSIKVVKDEFFCAYGERKDDETPDGRL